MLLPCSKTSMPFHCLQNQNALGGLLKSQTCFSLCLLYTLCLQWNLPSPFLKLTLQFAPTVPSIQMTPSSSPSLPHFPSMLVEIIPQSLEEEKSSLQDSFTDPVPIHTFLQVK